MPFDPKLLEILACPKCKGRLQLAADESSLACEPCRLAYPIIDEIPNLIIDDAKRLDG